MSPKRNHSAFQQVEINTKATLDAIANNQCVPDPDMDPAGKVGLTDPDPYYIIKTSSIFSICLCLIDIKK